MVKNEAAVIERSIASFRASGLVDYVFLCDTNSTDDTVWLAQRAWSHHDSDGTMFIDHPVSFENFEQARNTCKKHMVDALARRGIEHEIGYVLLADADYTIHPRRESVMPPPLFDVNMIQIHAGVAGHPHNALHMMVRYDVFKRHCRYRLWTHEYLDCTGNASVAYGHHSAFYYVDHADGVSRPDKLTRDIALLQRWLERRNESDLRPRALYYLARAHEDSGHWDKALATYALHDAEQRFTNYQFYSLYRQALIKQQQQKENTSASVSFDEVEQAFLRAHSHYDGYFRAEPLYHLARLHRFHGAIARCILYATAAVHAPPVDHDRMPLFLDAYVYEWAAEEELAYCLSLLNAPGATREAQRRYRAILDRNPATLDQASRKRIELATVAVQ